MSRFDRYLLSQLLALFGFFSLILVAVYWVNRAVGLFDQLIGDGQSALVFLEFSLLTLPNVIRLVLPVSAFMACLYVINRLSQESELVVMQSTGFSALRLARPVVLFGLCVMAMQLVLANVLVPMSLARLADRSAEISQNVTARFLTEGRFQHPTEGVTLYIREITETGELNDLFLSDERSSTERVVYTARRALIVRGEDAPRLVMLDGTVQRLLRDDSRRIAITGFADFTLDLSAIVKAAGGRARGLGDAATADLLTADPALLAATGETRAAALEEGHSRLAAPLLGLAAPLLGFAALMLGGYSRFGMWRQIGMGFLLIVAMQMANTAASGMAMQDERATVLVYAAPVLGIAVAFALVWWAQQPRRRRVVPA